MNGLNVAIFSILLLTPGAGFAQIMEGEIRVAVRDPDGLAVGLASVVLTGRNPQFEADTRTDSNGLARLGRVPLGVYRLIIRESGFSEFSTTVEVRSAVPRAILVPLEVAGATAAITVTDRAPLLDIAQPTAMIQVGRNRLDEVGGTTLGRSGIDVVTTLPGWLLEANAVLHPRGSEYDTQYVVDGMPIYDNRSIGSAPAFETSEFEAVNVMTGGMPAEYGRRLGGIIALDTRRVGARGHSTEFTSNVGSFDNRSGSLRYQFGTDNTSISLGGHGGYTHRYLDPPSLENFANEATAGGFDVRVDRDLTVNDRLSFSLRTNEARFQVPNDPVQQRAGQRQDRFSGETAARLHYQRVISARALGAVQVMYRDLSAGLWSNPLSTPVRVEGDRGFRESVLLGDLTLEGDSHTLKFGGDIRITDVGEEFRFGPTGTFPDFDVDFRDDGRSKDVSLYIQDHLRAGNFAANIGVRYDHYKLLIVDDAFSPRAALSYWVPVIDLQLHASYDRIFQPPPIENLLFSGAAPTLGVDEVGQSIPVPASRGHFFEIGVRKPFLGLVRLDVSHYQRRFSNYMDDDVFLNTGLSFPITFDTARISGTEVRLDLPAWRGLSSSVSYSNMIGHATSPVTGGVFIEGGEADELRVAGERFSISQDQRNTLSALLRLAPHERLWLSTGFRYGSGLPVELADDDDDAIQPISPAILGRVNFPRGRLRSVMSLDFSLGLQLWQRESRSVNVQFDVRNSTDHLNVVNFSGVFSGTALGPGRQFTVGTRMQF